MTNNIKLKNINLSDKLKSENITSKSVIEIFEYIQKGCLGFVLNRIAELTKVGSLTTAEHSEINCELNEIQSTYKFLIKYAIGRNSGFGKRRDVNQTSKQAVYVGLQNMYD